MADAPSDQNPTDRVVDLYKGIDELLDALRIPDEERKEVEKNLMEAIAADLLVRLGGQLSDEEREALAASGKGADEGGEPDLTVVADFFRGKFSQDELVETLAEATESVLADFAKEMQR